MIGTWRWNMTLGMCGVVLTLLFSFSSNGLQVTGLRCLYAFAAFFALAYLFRALLAIILRPGANEQTVSQTDQDESIGGSVDYSTPDDSGELNDLIKMSIDGTGNHRNEQTAFQPLTPPKLISTQNKPPEKLAEAIRHLTGGGDDD